MDVPTVQVQALIRLAHRASPGDPFKNGLIRVLLVDDNELWRRFISSTLSQKCSMEIVGEAADGLEALRKAQFLQPDLIVLDIGLPGINGLEVAGRIYGQSPLSKILFASANRSPEIVEAALRTGARGYVLKSEAGNDLLIAIAAVLEGKQFVSSCLRHAFQPMKPAIADNSEIRRARIHG